VEEWGDLRGPSAALHAQCYTIQYDSYEMEAMSELIDNLAAMIARYDLPTSPMCLLIVR
jgi:hypothetical protein